MKGGAKGLLAVVVLFGVLGGLLALLTQVDGCDFGGGGCAPSSNTYDRVRRR